MGLGPTLKQGNPGCRSEKWGSKSELSKSEVCLCVCVCVGGGGGGRAVRRTCIRQTKHIHSVSLKRGLDMY